MTSNLKVVSIFSCPLGLIETTAFNFFWFALSKVAQVEHEIRQWTSRWLDILPIKKFSTESFEVWTEFHSSFPLGPTGDLPNFNLKLGNEHFFQSRWKSLPMSHFYVKMPKLHLENLENLTVIFGTKIQISKWDFFSYFQALFTHCSKSSFFVQNSTF